MLSRSGYEAQGPPSRSYGWNADELVFTYRTVESQPVPMTVFPEGVEATAWFVQGRAGWASPGWGSTGTFQ